MTIYIIFAAALVLLILISILIKKSLKASKKSKKDSKNIKKEIELLKSKVYLNPKDYLSMYELANLEYQIGNTVPAIKKYEELINVSGLDNKEKTDICSKLEEYFTKLDRKYEAFKYTVKMSKLSPNNMPYFIKIGSILSKEGNNQLACDYFNRALLSKNDFEIDDIKAAAFSFFKIKEYKKCIVFLEELHKRFTAEAKSNNLESIQNLANVRRSLVSMYILSDELNIAIGFLEQTFLEKNIDETQKFYLEKVYLFILYKIGNSDKFKEMYDKFYASYKIKDRNPNIYPLLLDYAFYSYFLRDMDISLKLFEVLSGLDKEDLQIYDFGTILKYIGTIHQASSQLNKLRSAMSLDSSKSDNFERYVRKEDVEIWEKAVDTWDNSFMDIDYLLSSVSVAKTLNIDSILEELRLNSDADEINFKNILKVDKIYSLSKADFKKLCQNVIRTKLAYSIVQEYNDPLAQNDYGDQADYLTYHVKGDKKDLTLISFKRWKNVDVGELIIRDFLVMVNESGAKNGVLVLPVKLTNSAKSYVSYNNKITVYSRNQFNNLLKDERL